MSDTTSAVTIRVHVRLFASYRERAGTNRLETTLPSGATAGGLLDQLEAQVPGIKQARGLIAVNHAYVQPDTILQDGDEVALIPPVSGGR